MEKKEKFKAFVSGAGEKVRGALDGAIRAVDQNDDGKFNLEDVAVIAGSVGSAVKKGANAVRDSASERAKQKEQNSLRPLFPEEVAAADFSLPKLVRVVERDKKRAKSELCQGSVGYSSDHGDLHVVNIFEDSTDEFHLDFFPGANSEIYYVDPLEPRRYIALNEYFGYIQRACVNELVEIARVLGAKHVKVSYREEQNDVSSKKVKGHGKAAMAGEADVEHDLSEKKYSTIRVEKEEVLSGCEPSRPELHYLKNDPDVHTLIAGRMDGESRLLRDHLMVKLSNFCGIKEHDAVKIDAAIKGMKCKIETSFASEVKRESHRFLEYEIEF